MKSKTVLTIVIVVSLIVVGIVYFSRSYYRATQFVDPAKKLKSVTLQSRALNGASVTVANPDDLGVIRVWLNACGTRPINYIDTPPSRDSIILTYEDGSQATIPANIGGDSSDALTDSIEGDSFIRFGCVLYATDGPYGIDVIPKSLCPPPPSVELHKLIPTSSNTSPNN